MFIEYFFHLSVEERLVNFAIIPGPILQFHPDFAPELVMLCEYRDHGNLEDSSCQSQFTTLRFNIPFLSGQIWSKYFELSSGRSLSIGMQYLRSSPCEFTTVDTQSDKCEPYGVQPIVQSLLL
jgi:hypothetical protein